MSDTHESPTFNESVANISSLLDSDFDAATHDEIVDEAEDTEAAPSDTETDEAEQTLEDSDDAGETDEDAESSDDEIVADADSDDIELDLGEGLKLTKKAIREGFLRQEDYTRKTQETAKARKFYETNLHDVANLSGRVVETLAALQAQTIEQLQLLPDVDFEQLLADGDVAEYTIQKAAWDKRLQALSGIRERLAQAQAEKARQEQEIHKVKRAECEQTIAVIHPELANNRAVQIDFAQFLLGENFTKEQVDGNTDPRLLAYAYEAFKFRALQSQKAAAIKTVEAKPAMVKPGSASNKGSSEKTAFEKSMARLKRTGDVKDAQSVIKHLL